MCHRGSTWRNMSCVQKLQNVCSEEPAQQRLPLEGGRRSLAGKRSFTRCSYLLLYIYTHTHASIPPL